MLASLTTKPAGTERKRMKGRERQRKHRGGGERGEEYEIWEVLVYINRENGGPARTKTDS